MMDTTAKALEFVKDKNYPFWKLYKGPDRVAICDLAENPEATPQTGYELFQKELERLPAGRYKISVYRNSNGEKSALKWDFEKSYSPTNQTPGSMDIALAMEIARNQAEIKAELQQLNKKLDAIGEAMLAANDDDDDTKPIEYLKVFSGLFGRNATSAAPTAVAAPRPPVRGAF